MTGINDNLSLQLSDLSITKDSENCKLIAYPDPGTGGAPWTIGWGHAGSDVFKGLVWSQFKADSQLLVDMSYAENAVKHFVTWPLSQDEFIALCDFTFNVGSGSLAGSTLLRKLNAGDLDGALAEFSRWNRAGGHVLLGLTRRRDAESALFALGLNYSPATPLTAPDNVSVQLTPASVG